MQVEPFLDDAVGMQQDSGRDEVPPGYVWSLLDHNPRISGASMRSRGPWFYVSQALSAAPVGLAYAPYLAGEKLIAACSNGEIYDVPLAGPTAVSIATGLPAMDRQNPFFYRDKLYLPSTLGACRVLTYQPFTVTSLPASALQGRHGTFYRERLVLARSLGVSERVAFSKPGDPTLAWNAFSFIDTSASVNGVFAMRNQILVMHGEYVEQIRGTTPPDSDLSDPLGDMQLGVLWDRAGCFDARSIAGWQGNCVFADERGVHITDGGLVRNMVTQGGLESLWRATFEPGLVTDLPGTIYGDHYICTTRLSAGTSYTWVCHIPTRRWWRWKNIDAQAMVTSTTAPERMYATHTSTLRVTDVTQCMIPPAGGNDPDGNGVDILPEVETGWKRLSKRVGLRRIFDVFIYYLGYRTVDPGTDLIEVSMIDSPEETVYEVIGGLRQSTESERRKLLVARQVEGIALKIRALQSMEDFRIHSVGMSVEAEEEHRIR